MWYSDCVYAFGRQLKKTVRLTDKGNFSKAIITNDAYLLWTQMLVENVEKVIQVCLIIRLLIAIRAEYGI